MNRSAHNEQLASRCDALGLHHQVLSTGSPSTARIAVVAEFPGEMELQLNQPLVGNSGRYLWEQLRKIGITREMCYVTNVIKHKVTEFNNANKKNVPKEELQKWHAVLRAELESLSACQYVLILGGVALEAITGHTGIKKWRGSVLNFTREMGFQKNGHIMITYNPAFVARDPGVEFHFFIDMQRFKRVYNGTYKPHEITAIINPSKHQALEYLRSLRAARLPISFDIETIANETACIGFANNAHEGICINFRSHMAASAHSVADEMAIRLAIAEMFADSTQTFVAQNGNFDSHWLRYKDRIQTQVHYDTLLAHHTLYPTLPHSLAFLTTHYTEHPYYKDDKDEWRHVGDINKFWEYNVKDCCITRAAFTASRAELEKEKLDTFFYSHVMRLQPHLVGMTANGILQDLSLKETIAADLVKQLDELERDVITKGQLATGEQEFELNPRSHPQLRELFFNKLKLIGRGPSSDKDNRQRMRMHPNTSTASKELLNAIDRYAEEHKYFSTYVNTKVDEDGRMRSEFKQYGTTNAPGRLSSASVLWGTGTNLQNQPDKAKQMYIADNGYVLVYFDLSQAEARYVAVAWNVKGLLENFRLQATDPDKYDIHRLNAATIFRKPYDEIPKKDHFEDGTKTLRYQGKRGVHGFNYRLGPDEAAIKFGISLTDATYAHRMYHYTFPEVSKEWVNIRARVIKDRVLYNCFGRRWLLLSRVDDEEVLKSIVAFEPQSSIGDKVSQVIYQAQDDPEWPRSRNGLEAAVILNIHDALIAIARKQDAITVAQVFKRYAEQPLIVRGQELVIPAEIGISQPDKEGVHRWSTIQKVKL